jgi:hypothetical protein
MNPQPQPRILLVLRHVQTLCVLLAHNALPTFSLASASPLNPYDLTLQPPRTAPNSNPAHQPDLLNHLQNP